MKIEFEYEGGRHVYGQLFDAGEPVSPKFALTRQYVERAMNAFDTMEKALYGESMVKNAEFVVPLGPDKRAEDSEMTEKLKRRIQQEIKEQ